MTPDQMLTKNQVLIYTNYYKQSYFFDDTLLRLAQDGYRIVVLLTGDPGEFQAPRVQHANINVVTTNRTSYDGGMVLFKHHNLLVGDPDVKYLVHIDNDCYLSGTQELEAYLEAFKDGGYGYTSHLCNEATSMEHRDGDKAICHVHNQQMFDRDPGGPPTPEPHYENAYQITLRSVYEKITEQQAGHHRLYIDGIHKQGAKFGAHRANYVFNYSSYGEEWFHLGLIMDKYTAMETNEDLGKYNPESLFEQMRAGYFAAQEECYGSDIYSERFHARLNQYYQHMGGKDKVLDCWKEYTRGTCMENWQKVS